MNFRITLVVLVLTAAHAAASVRLPEIFASGMVLQRSAATPVWGWAEPGAHVRVAIGQAVAEAQAGNDGEWKLNLNLESSGPGPHEMAVNETKLTNVLIGQVWLCGGQSNMEWNLGSTLDAAAVIKESTNPNIRQFHVPKRSEEEPAADVRGRWTEAGPDTSARFTAVGYFFARDLQRELGTPIGLINATWGGSACETWMSAESLSAAKGLSDLASQVNNDVATYSARRQKFIQEFRQWLTDNGLSDQGGWTITEVNALPDDRWTAVKMPGEAPAGPEPGVVWLRRKLDIPAPSAGKPLALTLGPWVQMLEEVWWNGEKVADTTLDEFEMGRRPRKHEVPGRLVRAGPNELLVRLWSPSKPPNLGGWEDAFKAGPVLLQGQWEVTRELSSVPPGTSPPLPPVEPPPIQHTPSRAFNGMIAPLVPYGMAGVIWYQGEGNASRALQYHDIFPSLIRDWRRLWQREDLPFLWCQLANFKKKLDAPAESAWAELREAQTMTLSLPRTGQALTLDVGEAGDIHPRNKEVPGRRLADIALAEVYGRDRPVRGPTFGSVTLGEGKAVVRFADTAGGLTAAPVPETHFITSMPHKTAPLVRNSPNSQLEGFAICGPDRAWHWADASIDGDTVVVWSTRVPDPVAVRYAWADNPTANLRGRNGLPSTPFRTDNFPLTTEGKLLP